ncbi:Nucleotidyltransferase [Ramaria rubella]|nr:Nucleotidyltransferase [Ramaria rubella]
MSDSDNSNEYARGLCSKQGIFSGLVVHFIQTKIDPSELDLLYSLAESNGADVQSNIVQADVIVTRISMRRRLLRHISWDLARRKALVTPAWVTESIAKHERLPCGDYTAVCALDECTIANCPSHSAEPSVTRSIPHTPTSSSRQNLSYMSRFCVQRASPLVSENQDLLVRLGVIRDARALENDERSAMSYSRSIAVTDCSYFLTAYPLRITSSAQVMHLPFIGPKILTKIREYISFGDISEAVELTASSRFCSLKEFTRIHGIGPYTAHKLYDDGCRTLEDLDRWFGAKRERTEPVNPVKEGKAAVIRTMLELRDDISLTIPRHEVEEITKIIAQELKDIEPGCMHTICGGYRRGKLQCNDVDIVFTHPQYAKDRGLCKRLVERLQQKGLVTHVLSLFSFRSSNPAGASMQDHPRWDMLDKSFVIFRLPGVDRSKERHIHRRVDLICAPMEAYWTAVVGWTGSTMFERDLRLWAKQKMGLKFDSTGITRRRDMKPLYPTSERAVFETLGLQWVDPTLRNADL